MKAFVAVCKRFNIWMNTVAEVVLFIMMLLTVLDVILRTFGTPIVGTYELVAMMGAAVVGFAVPKTSWDRGHVYVDFLVENRSQAVSNCFFIATRIVGIIVFALLDYNITRKGIHLYYSGETSMTLRVPTYPVTFSLAFCFLIECFSLLTDIFRIFDSGETT
jgi:TRAP-type C4-dicarboxylate transport system permease small subunit